MHQRLKIARINLAAALGVVWVAGCDKRPAVNVTAPVQPQPQTGPEVDSARAFIALADIPPAVAAPMPVAEIKPLSERAAQQISAARALIDQQRYTEAALELERALRYDPQHPQIHRTLATLHAQAGNSERAKVHAQRALAINPDDAAAHYIVGRSVDPADPCAAIQAYKTALLCGDLAADPDVAALIHFQLAVALERERYLQAALEQFQAFDDLVSKTGMKAHDPELVTLLQSHHGSAGEDRARILEQLGRFAEAADAMAAVVSASTTAPIDPARFQRYARMLIRAGRTEAALQVARTLPLDDDEVVALLLEIHEHAGHAERILDDLRAKLVEQPENVRIVMKLAELLERFGQVAEARTELQRFVDVHADVFPARDRLLELLIRTASWADVLKVCIGGIQALPARVDEYESKVRNLAKQPDAVAALLDEPVTDPNPVDAYLRGILADAADRPSVAESFLKRSHQKDSTFVPTRMALGRLYLKFYRYEEALTVASRADESIPQDARLELLLGRLHERLDDVNQAALHFKAATQLNPGDSQALLEMAMLHRRSDDRLTAQRELRVLLDRNPDHDEAREALALTYVNDGKLDAAVEQIEELKRRTKSPHVRIRSQSLALLLRGRDVEEYRKALRAALDEHGPDTGTWLALADTYNEFEQSLALDAYRNVAAMDSDNESAALGVIFAEQRLLEYEKAAEHLAALLPRRPNRHAWRVGWGGSSWQIGLIELYLVLQDYDAAFALARQQEGRDGLDVPFRSRYRLAMLEALRLRGSREEMISLLKAWAESEIGDASEWSSRLAAEYIHQERIDLALPILESAFLARPNDKTALSEYVDALSAAKKHDQASQRILDWIAEDPENDDALAALLIVLSRQERDMDGRELVKSKLLQTRDRERFQGMEVLLLDRAKRHAEAAETIDSLIGGVMAAVRNLQEPPARRAAHPLSGERIERLPNEPFAIPQLQQRLEHLQVGLAEQLVEAGEYREAETRLRGWLEDARSPGSGLGYLLRLASCQRKQGDEIRAGETVESALKLQPNHVALSNEVAYGWIDRGIRLVEAERMIRYSVSREPRYMAFLDTFGWLLYKKGDFAEARKWLERALAAGTPKDPVVLDHLGDSCWRMNDHESAIRYWEQSLVLVRTLPETPNSDERRVRNTVERKIEDGRAGREPEVAALAVAAPEQKE